MVAEGNDFRLVTLLASFTCRGLLEGVEDIIYERSFFLGS